MIGDSRERLDGHPLPWPLRGCSAPPAVSAGEGVDSCEGQSSSCSRPFPKLDCHALLESLFSIFFSTRSKAIIRTFFFFLER